MKITISYYKRILSFMLISLFLVFIYNTKDGGIRWYSHRRVREKLIIMTYMRSGSSLTGDLFQHNDAVFYMYEPLWFTERSWRNLTGATELVFLNGTIMRMGYTDKFLREINIHVLKSALNCNFMEIDIGTLTNPLMVMSSSTKAFKKCADKQSDLTELKNCVRAIQNDCQRSEVIVIKVIRSSMLEMYHLMAKDPNVKVLHLLRDPRGTLRSQRLIGQFSWNNLSHSAQKHCRRVLLDLGQSKLISAVFPDRTVTLRYEDLVEKPVNVTEQLYRFVNLNLTGEIKDYIWNITYAGKPDSCNICTVRKNATATANEWRKKLSFDKVLDIQAKCSNLMDFLGYRSFNSDKDLSNDSLTSTNIKPFHVIDVKR